MAGSRVERVGTIFQRIRGLLQSGALKEQDKPIWYDVYAAFPPKVAPILDRHVDQRQPVDIVYREDLVRAKFYEVYGKSYAINLTEKDDSLSERFVQAYKSLELPSTAFDKVDHETFEASARKLSAEGFTLKTLAEVKQEIEEKKLQAMKERQLLELNAMKSQEALRSVLSFKDEMDSEDTMDTTEDKKT